MTVIFEGVEVELVPGSSGLLNKGILPIGTSGAVPMLKDRVEKGDNELVNKFIDTFGEFRVKSGVLGNLPGTINKLLGLTPVRTSNAGINVKPLGQAVARAIAVPVAAAEPFVYDQHNVPEEDVDTFASAMRNANVYSQQLGTSGHGKGTRLLMLMEFFKYLGFKSRQEYLAVDTSKKTPDNTYMIKAGEWFPELNTFIQGKLVKSNLSKLISWSSADTLTGPGTFDVMMGLIRKYKAVNYLHEGYVGMFSNQMHAYNIVKFGYATIHKVGYEYDVKEQLLARVVERSGRECKGDSSWVQNKLARQVIGIDQTYFDAHPEDREGVGRVVHLSMHRFDVDVNVYGVTFLETIEAPASVIEEFKAFAAKYSTLRHYESLDANYERFLFQYDQQQLGMNEAARNIGDLQKTSTLDRNLDY